MRKETSTLFRDECGIHAHLLLLLYLTLTPFSSFVIHRVKLKVNKMTSVKTLLPIDYYRLPFCLPEEGVKMENENFGEFLAGDRIENSPYKLKMKIDMYCEQLCVANLGHTEQPTVAPNKSVRAIRKSYHNNWIVDNLPAASKAENDSQTKTQYFQGFPVGFINEADHKSYINNHVNIEILYHPVENEANKYRVVQFTVEPFSIHHEFVETVDHASSILHDKQLPLKATINNPIPSCDVAKSVTEHTNYDMVTDSRQRPQEASGKVLFTYDVLWKSSDIHWASRWDVYLTMNHGVSAKVHWLSIANSLVIVCVLSAMIVAILIRNLHRDINRYNKVAMDEEARAEELEEYGWKLVHADVFRPPSFSPMLLAVSCGTGAQLLIMTLFTIFFSSLGFMNPARRGHLLIGVLSMFVLFGSLNGYVTSRLYKTFKGKAWQRATAVAAFGLPGVAFGLFLIMNIVALAKKSTDAVPFTTILILIVMWFGISTPLVFFGAYVGFKQDAIEFPVSTSSIPRQIPDQPWFMGIPFTLAIGGILPFGSCFVELYFIMSSVWMELYYYVFGFLLLVFFILVITCAEITTLFTYFQLCSEDYHWWWRSFCNGGSTAIYVFLYSFVYFKQLEANSLASYVLYFGYMGLVSICLFTMMGFVGLSTSLWFNKTIFASIKID
jgi:transmembrane 9 superfamily member 2/4